MQRINHFISLFSALLVLFLAGSAFFLSFESLKDLAVQIGVAEEIAWLYPAIIDGAIIIFSLSVLRANLTRARTVYPWVLVSVFTLLSVVLNIIHAPQELLAQFLAAIPPVALFLSFELLLAHLKETAVRLEAQNSLEDIVLEVRKKEAELDALVRERKETIEKLEGEIEQLTEKKGKLKTEIQAYPNGNSVSKASESDTIGRARRQRTSKKQEVMQQLLGVIRTKPNATLSELAVEIGRSKSTVGGYLSEMQVTQLIEKGEFGWKELEDVSV
jgi:FtsZ-binding cell division protein ZapB